MKKKNEDHFRVNKGIRIRLGSYSTFCYGPVLLLFFFLVFFFHFYGLFSQTRLLPFLDVTKNKRYTHPSWMGAFSLLGGFDLGFSQFLYRVLSAFCSALLPVVFDLAEVQLWSSFDPALILF